MLSEHLSNLIPILNWQKSLSADDGGFKVVAESDSILTQRSQDLIEKLTSKEDVCHINDELNENG